MTAFTSILREMAFFAELKGDNPFKIRALQNSAETLDEIGKPLEELVNSGEIKKIPGVGKGTQALVKEFLETGKVKEHEEARKEFPAGILELLEVRGLGPKKIKALIDQLGIGSLTELEYACQENRLVDLKGFGQKSQDSILKNIQSLKAQKGKAVLPMALQQARAAREMLSELDGVERVEETGSLRRLLPVLGDLEFLVSGEEESLGATFMDAGFTKREGYWEKLEDDLLPLRVWISEEESFGTKLLETTGPEDFLKKFGELPAKAKEADVFHACGIELIPAETRDLGIAPKGLIETKDIKGVFHLHTTWSDGKHSLEEMAAAAVELGYEYMGVSDHSHTASYAKGLSKDRVVEQKKEIKRLQEKFPSLKIFHGIESDILSDGGLDYQDDILMLFDFVIASVHSQMTMSPETMTQRICRALEHPATTWLGHWTGRLLLGREGFRFDQEKVLQVAARNNKGIELNASPYRLDMDWQLLPQAARLGISIGIFPDAHHKGGLADVKYGVAMARKAGLTKSQVINTKSRKEMETWLAERKFH